MDPYSQNSKRKMSYRKPAPIYVPTPPSSPPQAIRESVRYSFAEAALGMNMSSSRPHDWRFTTASVASQSTVSFPSSDDDGESTYDIPFAPELATREVRKTLVHHSSLHRPNTSMTRRSPPPLKGRGAHQVYRPPTPPQAAQMRPLPVDRRKSVQSTLYPVLPPASKALPNIPILAELPPWEEFMPLSPSPKMVPLMVSDVHKEHIPLPPSQMMLPAIPQSVRRSTMPSKTWGEGSACTWDSSWQDLPTLRHHDTSFTSSQRKSEKPRSETSPSLLGLLRSKLGTYISEINLPVC